MVCRSDRESGGGRPLIHSGGVLASATPSASWHERRNRAVRPGFKDSPLSRILISATPVSTWGTQRNGCS